MIEPTNSIRTRWPATDAILREGKGMTGFSITCLRCGATMSIQPGVRDQDREPIGFGFDQIRESTLIHCRKCRNGLESEDRWEDGKEPDEVKLVEYWIDASDVKGANANE